MLASKRILENPNKEILPLCLIVWVFKNEELEKTDDDSVKITLEAELVWGAYLESLFWFKALLVLW